MTAEADGSAVDSGDGPGTGDAVRSVMAEADLSERARLLDDLHSLLSRELDGAGNP